MPNEEEGDGDEVIPTFLAMNNGKTGEKGGPSFSFPNRVFIRKTDVQFCWGLLVFVRE